MKPIYETPNIVVGTQPIRTGSYGFDLEDQVRVMEMFRDQTYSKKIEAVVREYGTNAIDEHRIHKVNRPIEVTLPTLEHPEFKVRDFALGLSEDGIFDIYVRYCKSRKRDTNEADGMLGIGSKSGFCYGDNFIVTSYHGGWVYVVNCLITGGVDLISKREMAEGEESGLEVIIPVKLDDIDEFVSSAFHVFSFWETPPKMFGISEEQQKQFDDLHKEHSPLKGNGWEIRPIKPHDSVSYAVMGNVAYPIDWQQIINYGTKRQILKTDDYDPIYNTIRFLQSNRTILRFPTGSLGFSTSRESLSYKDYTFQSLFERLKIVHKELSQTISDKIKDSSNLWEAMIRRNEIFGADGQKSLFQGNISGLENATNTEFSWNGIKVKKFFDSLDHWSESRGYQKSTSVSDPVIQIFQEKLSRYGQSRVSKKNGTQSRLTPNRSTVLLIDDLEGKGAQTIARHLIIGSRKESKNNLGNTINSSTITRVVMLKFGSDRIKSSFFKFYKFNTVPVQYASKLIGAARDWAKQNREVDKDLAPRTTSVRYIDIEYGYRAWSKHEISVHEIEEAYFIPIWTEGTQVHITLPNKTTLTLCSNTFNNFHSSIKCLLNVFNINTKRIYGILPRTLESKWFTKAVEEGQWINLWEEFKDCLEENPNLLEQGLEAKEYWKCVYETNTNIIPIDWRITGELEKKVKYVNSPIKKGCSLVTKSVKDNQKLVESLKFLTLFPNIKDQKEKFTPTFQEIGTTYPLIKFLSFSDKFRGKSSEKPSKEEMDQLIEYINLIDLKNQQNLIDSLVSE